MSGKKTGRKSTAKKTTRSSAAKKTTRSEADKAREREQTRSDRADAAVGGGNKRQSPKDTGPGANPDGAGVEAREGFDLTHGRYRDEVVDTDPTVTPNVIVRRTFLASKTEFEVEVPRLAGGGPGEPRAKWEKAIKAAAQTALNIRTQQLSSEVDNSDLGGKSIAQPKGGGTFNPENKYAPRPSQGESAAEEIPRKGQGAPTTTGRPIEEASIRGTPNDRTASSGTSKSAEEVAKATT